MDDEILTFPISEDTLAKHRKGKPRAWLCLAAGLVLFFILVWLKMYPLLYWALFLFGWGIYRLWRIRHDYDMAKLGPHSIRLFNREACHEVPYTDIGGSWLYATQVLTVEGMVLNVRGLNGKKLFSLNEAFSDFLILVPELRRRVAMAGGTPGDAEGDDRKRRSRRRNSVRIGASITLLTFAMFAFTGYMVVQDGREHRAFRERGAFAEAEIVDVPDGIIPKVTYTFLDDNGNRHTKSERVGTQHRHLFDIGDTGYVVYLPDDPGTSTLSSNWIIERPLWILALVMVPILIPLGLLVLYCLGYDITAGTKGLWLLRPGELLEDRLQKVRLKHAEVF